MQKFFGGTALVLGLLFLSSCGNTKKTTSTSRPPSFHEQKRLRFKHETLKDDAEALPRNESTGLEAYESNPELYSFIDEWEGTPHRMGGNTKKGVDCSGFVINCYNEVYRNPFQGRRAEDLFSETQPVRQSDLQEGDLVFFKINGRRIDHVGIYLSKGNFVHASSSQGVIISNLEETYYKKRFFMGGRRSDS